MLSFWLSLTTTQQGNTAWKEPIDSTADSVRGYLIFGAASASDAAEQFNLAVLPSWGRSPVDR